MKYLATILAAAVLFLSIGHPAVSAQEVGVFKTKYTAIYYDQKKDIDDFIWRLGGQKTEFSSDTALASSRVDRIVERVVNILDMWPKKFEVKVYLHRGRLDSDRAAYFDPKTRSIHISVDDTSDGVFAHEIAHAILNHNYNNVLPSKMQEILTQYVDKYLYSDY